MLISLRSGLSSHLLDLDDHELSGLQWRKAHQNVHDAIVLVGWGCGLAVALDEVGLLRRCSLERALAEQRLHEGAYVQANLRPQWRIVGLKHHPLRAAIEALLDVQRQAADRYVFPLRPEF